MKSAEVLADCQTTDANVNGVMKAPVCHGPHQRSWQDRPRPIIRERGDAIVRISDSPP